MMAERSLIRWGTTEIPYGIRRSSRRGTVSIGVEPSGDVMVTAPDKVSIERLDRVVRAKAPWIVEKLRRTSDLPPPLAKREFVSGETFHYLGGQYRLRVIGGEPRPLSLRRGRMEVPVPTGLDGEHHPGYVRAALVDWYRRRAADRLRHLAMKLAERLGTPLAGIMVREQSKRWGSCDARGVLRINWRIIQAPTSLIEYVLVHELTHLEHPNHDRAFWSALGRAMPDYEDRRARLRELGPRLEW